MWTTTRACKAIILREIRTCRFPKMTRRHLRSLWYVPENPRHRDAQWKAFFGVVFSGTERRFQSLLKGEWEEPGNPLVDINKLMEREGITPRPPFRSPRP